MAENEVAKYFETLKPDVKRRYKEKLVFIENSDPYTLKKSDFIFIGNKNGEFTNDAVKLLPPLAFPDVFTYLISGISPYTHQMLKNYKSLEAFDQFTSGFVRDVGVTKFKSCENVLAKCKVMHSQRLREKNLEPWVILDATGSVMSAHCTCMAGLDECCTHVAALLFYLEYAVRFRESTTVTGEKAYWVVPITKEPAYSPVSDMNLTSAKSKKKVLDALAAGETPKKPKSNVRVPKKHIREFTKEELEEFHEEVFSESPNLAIFRVLPKYFKHSIPKCTNNETYPIILTELFQEDLMKLSFSELLAHSELVNINFSQEQANRVELQTKNQSKTHMWHRFRSGRVTASNLRKVCHSDPAMPSKSLIQTVCYPGVKVFENEATRWGLKHEETMRGEYHKLMKTKHSNFILKSSGLILNPRYPHLGASPDGIVCCDCCGDGVLEIKCPFSFKLTSVNEINPKSCLENTTNGPRLKREHEYYYQVQSQIFLSGSKYADFCVWTTVDFHCERIVPDECLWESANLKAERFFRYALLPELTAKFFTSEITLKNKKNKNDETKDDAYISQTTTVLSPSKKREKDLNVNTVELWCYCRKEESGEMIYCENENCTIQWFHTTCLKITQVPKGKWHCPDCKKIILAEKKTKQKTKKTASQYKKK